MVAVVGAALAFALRRGERQPSLAVLYCALYVSSLLLIPYPDTLRYTFPILPFLLAWTTGGLRASLPGRAGAIALVALVAAAVATDVRQVARHQRDPERAAELHRMTDWIAANLPPDAVLVGAWDPTYYLLSGRRAVRVHVNDTLAIYYAGQVTTEFREARDLADAFQRMGACWFVHDPIIGGSEAVYFERALAAVEAASPVPFEQVYASADGRFTIRRRPDCPPRGS
jgi:hypothetical protein